MNMSNKYKRSTYDYEDTIPWVIPKRLGIFDKRDLKFFLDTIGDFGSQGKVQKKLIDRINIIIPLLCEGYSLSEVGTILKISGPMVQNIVERSKRVFRFRFNKNYLWK